MTIHLSKLWGRRGLTPPSPWFLIVKYMFLIYLDMFWLGGPVYNIYGYAFFNIFGKFTDGGQEGLF